MIVKYDNVTLLILAGGRSKRFGSDKSNFKLNNKTFIDTILDKTQNYFGEILISCNKSQSHLSKYKLKLSYDIGEKNQGPLWAIYSSSLNIKSEWVCVIPCDSPYFKITTITNMIEKSMKKKHYLTLLKNKNDFLFTFLFFHNSLFKSLKKYAINGGKSIKGWVLENAYKEYNVDENIVNINCKTDLQKLNQ